jgi:Family of unknown function (DUF5906)
VVSPFQSILPRSHELPKPANDDQHRETAETTIGDLLAELTAHSPDSSPMSTTTLSDNGLAFYPHSRPPLRGGIYPETYAIDLMNRHYFVGRNKEETVICRINDDGSAQLIPSEQFKLEVAHLRVSASGRLIPAEKFWKESPDRHERELVFKPGRSAGPHEYNLWRGFSVQLQPGWQKQRRFLRHLRRVICRRDKDKFKYVMRLLAWFVQNPDKHAGVVLVLKSREQGTGKSTVGKVMLDIFGLHGVLVDDKDRLLGRFTDWLETTCFVLAEEILFAGDLKSADKMKSMITGDLLQVERKFGNCRVVQNRLKAIATTNHDHAIAAGVRDRRYVVFDVSNECVGDKDWFDGLYRDLAAGGTSEFLWLLTNLRLGSWHPRMTIKTEETTEQQRMSGDSVSQWSQACIIADAIIGLDQAAYGVTLDLGAPVSFSELFKAYTGFCKQGGQRALPSEIFGKACADMFGPRKRLRALSTSASGTIKRRPWGYHVPKGTKWQEKVDARLGVTS